MKRKLSLTLTVSLLAALFTVIPAQAGPTWEYGEASWMQLDLLGQIQYSFLDEVVDGDDFYLRRFRILVNGQITEGIKVFAQTDYSNAGKSDSDPEFTLLDGWADVRLFGSDHWVKGGLIPLPFSMENRSAVGALLGLDYNTEIIKLVNDSTWRDVGAVLQGTFAKRIGYRAGIFDGYESSEKNSDADLRFTGRIDVAVLGEVLTGWYVQDTVGGDTYLRIGGGYDQQNKATLVTPELLDPVAAAAVTPTPVDSKAWVLDLQSGYKFSDALFLTVNGAWYDWDNSEFKGNTAFVEAGLRYNEAIGTFKYSLQDPEGDSKTTDYTAGLHYNLKGNNLKGGVEYRWGDSADWWLVGVQFLL